jgi:HD-GYP domain-containing protein (c-di-GMP phosphodiesterase class II)
MPHSSLFKEWLPQPAIAAILVCGSAAVVWHERIELLHEIISLTFTNTLMCFALVVCSLIADSLTIHISYETKTTLGGTILFLMAVMLPPELAICLAFLSTFAIVTWHKRSRSLYWSDILTDSCRIGLVCFIAAELHHNLRPYTSELIYLTGPALAILLGDYLTMPLLIGPITKQRPSVLLRSLIRDMLLIDGPQYMLAVPIAVVIHHALEVLPMLLIPLIVTFQVFRSRYHLQDGTRALLEQMADMVDLRDPYTGGHSRRVAEYTAKILNHLKRNGPDVELITTAARIHDIGKIGVADAILNKEGTLTDEEWKEMKQHPVLGANLLLRYPDFARGVAIVRHHHERLDGRGYPDGLHGDEIPFGAQVIAVADTWDALTSDRPYRKGMPIERAVAILCDGRNIQWRADLVDALLLDLGHEDLLKRSLQPLPEQDRQTQLMPNTAK